MTYEDIIKMLFKPSGFFDLPKDQTCKSLEHDPPMHLYIPPGKGYRHVCPSCGKETIIQGSNISC